MLRTRFLQNVINDLDASLIGAGVTGNRYGLVGFGGLDESASQLPHKHLVGGGDFGSATQFQTAAGGLVVSGGIEDGYNAMDFALNNYSLRNDAARQFILVTDEDRDDQNTALNFSVILNSLPRSPRPSSTSKCRKLPPFPN